MWKFIECKVVCGTSGSYVVRVAGVTVLSGTGNTKAGTHAYHDHFDIGAAFGGLTTFDDLYALDGTGPVNNDFLGDLKVVAIFPNAAGDSTQWTPSSGNNYAAVNENPPDADSSYVENATTGHKDLYNYGDLSGLSTIYGVQISTEARLTDVGSLTLKTSAKTSGTESDDAGQTVATQTWLDYRRIHGEGPLEQCVDAEQLEFHAIWRARWLEVFYDGNTSCHTANGRSAWRTHCGHLSAPCQ